MTRGDGPSLPIDVVIAGVGRIKKQSGVHDRRERDEMVAMLRTLPKQGHLELVRGIHENRWTILEVYAHYTAGTLARLSGPQDDQALDTLLEPWLETALCADGTRENRRAAFRALKSDGRRVYALRDVPGMLAAYRRTCEAAGHPRAFNVAKTCVQAFLRDMVGRRHQLWIDVADTEKLRERGEGLSGFSVTEALAVRDDLSPVVGRAWWSMCLTGMGPKEFWVDGWTVADDRVHIKGEKAFGRVRDVPLVDMPVRPEISRRGYVTALRRLSVRRLTALFTERLEREPTRQELATAMREERGEIWHVAPYRARKTFARWAEDAGVPRVRRLMYLGHGKQDVTDRYERYQVQEFLREDARRMRALLPQQGLRVVP
jgi:hypothetical protein